MLEKMPKVLVGCPTCDVYNYCLNDYMNIVKNLTYINYDVVLVDNSKTDEYAKKLINLGFKVIKDSYKEDARDRITSSRNILKNYMLDNGYDYLFSLEQDVIPPTDIIERLLSYNKMIVSATYFNYVKWNNNDLLVPLLIIGKNSKDFKARYMRIEELSPPRLTKVKSCGLGCVLIHKDVLNRVEFRYEKAKKGFDDVWFCIDSKRLGFEIFADTGILCKHLIKNKPWRWNL